MSTTTPSTTSPPTSNQNSTSSNEGDRLPQELKAAENKAAEAAWWDKWVSRLAKTLLLLYVLITALGAATTVWNNKTTGTLRAAEGELNNLQKEKIRTDGARELQLRTEEVRGEAGKKIEDARAEAGVKIEKAKADADAKAAELAKEQTKLAVEQGKTAKAQRLQAEAQLALKKHLEEVAERQRPRLTADQRSQLVALLKEGPKGKILLQGVFNDPGALKLADDLEVVLKEAGWEVLDVGFVASTLVDVHLMIQVRDTKHAPARAAHILKSLRAIGLSVGSESSAAIEEGGLVLIVGSKP